MICLLPNLTKLTLFFLRRLCAARYFSGVCLFLAFFPFVLCFFVFGLLCFVAFLASLFLSFSLHSFLDQSQSTAHHLQVLCFVWPASTVFVSFAFSCTFSSFLEERTVFLHCLTLPSSRRPLPANLHCPTDPRGHTHGQQKECIRGHANACHHLPKICCPNKAPVSSRHASSTSPSQDRDVLHSTPPHPPEQCRCNTCA